MAPPGLRLPVAPVGAPGLKCGREEDRTDPLAERHLQEDRPGDPRTRRWTREVQSQAREPQTQEQPSVRLQEEDQRGEGLRGGQEGA